MLTLVYRLKPNSTSVLRCVATSVSGERWDSNREPMKFGKLESRHTTDVLVGSVNVGRHVGIFDAYRVCSYFCVLCFQSLYLKYKDLVLYD